MAKTLTLKNLPDTALGAATPTAEEELKRRRPCEAALAPTCSIPMRSVCSSGKGGRDCCRHQCVEPYELRNVHSGDLRRDLLQQSVAVALMQEAEDILSAHEKPVSSEHVLQLVNTSFS